MLHDVLAKLDAVQKHGDYYTARCPAHDDKVRSLSIKEGDKGVVLKCHASCDFTSIVTALGMKPSDLFYDNGTTAPNEQKISATYDYVNEHGEPLYQVVRLEPKGFRQRRMENGGWVWSLGDAKRVLYNLPAVLEQKERGGYILVVEGEKDVNRLTAEGFTATTNAGGATAWRDDYTETLAGAKGLIILPDNDDPGKKHAYTVQAALKEKGTESRIIELPGLAEKGDISDWFNHGGTAEALKKLIKSDFVRPADLVNLTDALSFIEKHTHEPLPTGLTYPWPKINRLTRGARGGWLTIMAGRPAFGKTAAAIEMATYTAQRGGRVLFVSLEMSCEELAVRVAQKYGLDTWRFYSSNPLKDDQEAAAVALGIPYHSNIEVAYAPTLSRIDQLIGIYKPDLVIVDYLQLMDIGSASRTEGTNKIAVGLKAAASKYNVPVLALSQLSRAPRAERNLVPTMFDLKDSGTLEQAAYQIIFVHREVDENSDPLPEGKFVVAKSKMGRRGQESFIFDGQTQVFEMGG